MDRGTSHTQSVIRFSGEKKDNFIRIVLFSMTDLSSDSLRCLTLVGGE